MKQKNEREWSAGGKYANLRVRLRVIGFICGWFAKIHMIFFCVG